MLAGFFMMGCGLPKDFVYEAGNGYYGTVELTGYVVISEIEEAWCFVEDCEIFDYAQFEILEASDYTIYAMVGSASDGKSSFLGENSVGLGCITDGLIEYANHSDKFDYQEFVLTAEDSEAILSATENEPVTIILEKYPATLGKGAPTCYSHFTSIDLL